MEKSKSTKLFAVLKTTTALFKKAPLTFIALWLIPAIAITSIQIARPFIFSSTGAPAIDLVTMIIGGIFIIIIILLIRDIALYAIFRGAYLADTKGKFTFGESLKASLKKLGKIIGLSVRVFFYTGFWLGIVVVVPYIFLGMYYNKVQMEGGTSAMAQLSPMLLIAGIVLPILIVVMSIVVVLRYLRAVFASSLLMSKDITSKEALNESIKITKKRTGRVFANSFLLSLILGILVFVVQQLLLQILGLFVHPPIESADLLRYQTITGTLAMLIPSLISAPFSGVFWYAFMKAMRAEKTSTEAAS